MNSDSENSQVAPDDELAKDIHEDKGVGTDADELIGDMLDDDYDIEKNDVDYSHTEGWFVFNNRGLSFSWKPSRIGIIDKSSNGYVTMERYDLIEFLQKSDFLPQHGYKIVKSGKKNDGDKDISVEIKVNGQIITVKQRQKNADKN